MSRLSKEWTDLWPGRRQLVDEFPGTWRQARYHQDVARDPCWQSLEIMVETGTGLLMKGREWFGISRRAQPEIVQIVISRSLVHLGLVSELQYPNHPRDILGGHSR